MGVMRWLVLAALSVGIAAAIPTNHIPDDSYENLELHFGLELALAANPGVAPQAPSPPRPGPALRQESLGESFGESFGGPPGPTPRRHAVPEADDDDE